MQFLQTIKDLELYLVGFDLDGIMKPKPHHKKFFVRVEEHFLVIVIMNDEHEFSANDNICKK